MGFSTDSETETMKTIDLCIHAGGNRVERQVVAETETPPSTKSWHPIPHMTLINLVQDHLRSTGLQVVQEQHALARDGQRYFGLMQVTNGSASDEYGLVVGLRNSHDKCFPASLAMGSGVFVCDNLAFSGQIVLGRRHTRYIMRDLPGIVAKASGRLGKLRVDMDTRMAAYKAETITDQQAYAAIIEMLLAKVFTTTAVGEVVQEWRHPSYDEFAQDRSVWRLMQAVTTVGKTRGSLWDAPQRHEKLHGMLDSLSGLTIDGEVVSYEVTG